MEFNNGLIQEVEMLASADSCHQAAKLIGTYRRSIEEFARGGDSSFLAIAREAEHSLRVLLAQLRFRRANVLL